MANKKKKEDSLPKVRFGALKKIASNLQSNTDDLYKSTYYTDPYNKQMLKTIKTNIDDSIKDIMVHNADSIGEPNVSRLYERLFMSAQNDMDTNKEFSEIFEDNEFITQLTNSYLDNKFVLVQDQEIDDILK